MFMSTAIPEKFLEDDLKAQQLRSQGCLYQYIEKKKLLDGSTAFCPRMIGERDPENPQSWRWAYNWERESGRDMERAKYWFDSLWCRYHDSLFAAAGSGQGGYHRFHQKSENQKLLPKNFRCLQKF